MEGSVKKKGVWAEKSKCCKRRIRVHLGRASYCVTRGEAKRLVVDLYDGLNPKWWKP